STGWNLYISAWRNAGVSSVLPFLGSFDVLALRVPLRPIGRTKRYPHHKKTDDELQLAVGVQAGQEHVDAQEGEAGDQQAYQGPVGGHGASQAFHQTHVQPGGVVEPDD